MSAASPVELEHVFGARGLLHEIESVLVGDSDAAQLHRSLIFSNDVFLNLLSFKPPNAQSRAIIESGNVHTTEGLITLDRVPDIHQILLLSDELKLNELTALAVVLAGQEQSGLVSAAAAAGIMYEERMCAVQALLSLLHAQVTCGDLPADVYSTIASFNAGLLQAEEGGATVLVKRLAEIIQSDSVQPNSNLSGSQLPVVYDKYGRSLDRADIIHRECTALCQCLFYACCIKQRMTATDIERLLDLLHHLTLHARAPGPYQLAAQHQANLVLLSILLTLLPLEDVQDQAQSEDDRFLRQLASSTAVDAKIKAKVSGDDAYSAAVRLAWGILPLCVDEQSLTKRGIADIEAALQNGVLNFLGSGVLNSTQMADEDQDIKLTAASVVYQLLGLFVEVASEGIAVLRQRTTEGVGEKQEEAAAAAANDSAALMVVDARSGGMAPSMTVQHYGPDTISTLLQSLAAAFALHPALWHEGAARSAPVGELLMEIGTDTAMHTKPSVFLGYVSVLTALAKSEIGARTVFAQLRGDNAKMLVSWRRFFDILRQVIQMYNAANAGKDGGVKEPTTASDIILPANDTKGLCALAHMFETVMLEGSPDEVASWIRQLDEEAGIAPSYEVLFQAMCCPVPQSLKASLDAAIASMARRPDLASALWDRLVACVVVQPYTAAGAALSAAGAAVPRFDIVYQLNEIESRAEDYQEALSFVELLNALWRAGGPAMPDEGRSVSHLTRFVRDELLGTIFQRAFKDESQRWNIVAAGLEHCRLCLESMTSSPAMMAADLASGAALNRAPGLDVLLDLLGEKNVARVALTTLAQGVDRFAAERHTTTFGAAKEASALAALRLLHSVMQCDAYFVAAVRRSLQHGSYETFEAVLRHDRSRIPDLFQFVQYPFNPKIQEEAIKLGTSIAERTPNLVQVLLTVPITANGKSNGTANVAQKLQDCFAAYMNDAIHSSPLPPDAEEEDPRASLALELLLHCLDAPTPNLTQLLCGFWIDGGSLPLMLHDPNAAIHTILRVILDVLSQPRFATLRPRVFEQCLELVYELADRFETGPATIDLLRSYTAGVLVPLLDSVACTPLPASAPSRGASLHQRAWLLQLLALGLHRADAALTGEKESIQSTLHALFGGDDTNRGRFIDILAVAVGDIPLEPQLGATASAEARRMIQALDIESLIASQSSQLQIVGPRGDPMIDVAALKDELLNKYNDWVNRHGTPGEALKESGRAALAYAADFNAYAEEMGGRMALLQAWQAVMSVAFSGRFELVTNVLNRIDLIMLAAEHSLEAGALLLQGPAAGLAAPLCSTVEALFARLQDQTITVATEDPLAGLPLPSRCHNLLSGLLTVAWEGRAQESIRIVLYNALVSYLAMCKGPSVLQAPPTIVELLLEGNSDRFDALHLQLEEGNVAVLHSNGRLIQILAQDAVSPNAVMSTSALTALTSIVAADPTTVFADEIHRIALPARLLQDLQDQAPEVFVQPPPAGQAATLVAEAKLALLLRLALAGPPTHRASSAQKIFSLHALVRLSSCRALGLQPEEPGFTSTTSISLRQRLHLLVTPALRLVLALVTALPHSAPVREQTAGFVEAHARALSRILRDTASSGVRGWEPADAEIEQASLVVQLLSELMPHGGLLPPTVAPALQESCYRAAARFFASNTRSQSPPVVRVAAAIDAGTATVADHQTYNKIVALRCALASYLRLLTSKSDTLFPCTPPTGAADLSAVSPTLFLIKDALLQAAVHDLPDALNEQAIVMNALGNNYSEDLVRAATIKSTEINRLGYLIEHLLAILFQHLKAKSKNIHALGSIKDLDQLRRLTEPAIAALEVVVAERVLPGDAASFELLIRRTKEMLLIAASQY